jgi:hypothetical protein
MNRGDATLSGKDRKCSSPQMTIILSTRLAIPTHPACGEHLSRRVRLCAILRFRKTYASVKWSSVSNSNEELGADPDSRVVTFGSLTSRVLREGGAE